MSRRLPARLLELAAWSCGLGIVAWLVGRVGWAPILNRLRHGAGLSFALFALLATALPLPLDAWATARAIARLGIHVAPRDVLLGRGASYLAGLLNYAVGQGSMALILVRRGVPALRATGAMLFVLATTGLATMAITLVGTLLGPAILRTGALAWLPAASALAVAGYLPGLAIARRLPGLRRQPILAELLDASASDHLLAALARLPHLTAMSLFGWGLFRVWGLALPAAVGIAAVPVVLLVASLPITPAGLGTVPATQVALFAPFLPQLPPDLREAEILACALAAQALALAAQAAIGLAALALLRRRERSAARDRS